jgi:hypothetical protein
VSAQVIPLRPDTYLPLRFETPPPEAVEMHRQYQLVSSIMERVQRLRNEIHQSAEPLPPEKEQMLRYAAEDLGL